MDRPITQLSGVMGLMRARALMGPNPLWALAHMGPGPYWPGPMGARAHMGPYGPITQLSGVMGPNVE